MVRGGGLVVRAWTPPLPGGPAVATTRAGVGPTRGAAQCLGSPHAGMIGAGTVVDLGPATALQPGLVVGVARSCCLWPSLFLSGSLSIFEDGHGYRAGVRRSRSVGRPLPMTPHARRWTPDAGRQRASAASGRPPADADGDTQAHVRTRGEVARPLGFPSPTSPATGAARHGQTCAAGWPKGRGRGPLARSMTRLGLPPHVGIPRTCRSRRCGPGLGLGLPPASMTPHIAHVGMEQLPVPPVPPVPVPRRCRSEALSAGTSGGTPGTPP